MNPTEQQIQQAIISFLKYKGIYCQRLNSGAVKVTNKYGKQHMMMLAAKGTGDLLIGIPINNVWAMGFIEVKKEGGKLTFSQEMFQKECQEKGILYIIARSIEDAERGINEYVESVRILR